MKNIHDKSCSKNTKMLWLIQRINFATKDDKKYLIKVALNRNYYSAASIVNRSKRLLKLYSLTKYAKSQAQIAKKS